MMKLLLLLASACAVPFFQIPLQLHPGVPRGQEASVAASEDFDHWTLKQSQFAFLRILDNIGGLLSLASVPEGVVLASPLKAHPDYYYNWIRDSALTIRLLIHEMRDATHGTDSARIHTLATAPLSVFLKSVVELYIQVNHRLQRLRNRSGHFADRSGLGEPKFMADMSVFDGSWGRPQSDGPALRVLTIASFINFLDETHQAFGPVLNDLFVYHEVVRPDLEYILGHWRAPLFDLWEEVNAMHFFTVLVQLRAISDGSVLAARNADGAFQQRLQEAFAEINEYIASAGFAGPLHMVETPHFEERQGLDAASLLAALHAHNMDFGGTDHVPYDVDDPHILNTIAALVLVMKRLYPINSGPDVALGRYPEDVYNGDGTSEGNPWFICTASAAEVLYKMVYKRRARPSAIHTSELGPFVQLLGLEDAGDLQPGTLQWRQFLDLSVALADSFLRKIRLHVNKDGHMLEQFNKYTGFMQGAPDLTWSYLSFYNCVRWREAVRAQHRPLRAMSQ